MYSKTVLDNGLRIVTAEMAAARSVSICIFLGAGSRYETKESQGVFHFGEHMLFKGTERRPTAREISEAIEGIGGILNAEAGKELTVYWAKVPQQHWRVALDILADILCHSLFLPTEMEKERKVIIEELNMVMDNPNEWVHILFDELIWQDQPLAHDIGGTKETVSCLTWEQLLGWLAQLYVPGNAVVGVAGNITHDEAVEEVARLLGHWPGRPDVIRSVEPAVDSQGSPRLRLKSKDTEQAHLCLGVPGLSYVHPDRFALDLLNVVFGEGMSSRLFTEIREMQGLAYDVHSYVTHYRDVGSAIIYAGIAPQQIDLTIRAILAEAAKLRAPISQKEMSKAKEFWKGRMLMRMEDTSGVASWMGGQELLLDRIMTVEELIDIIDAITVEDLQRVAQSLLATEKLNLAVIGPYQDPAPFERLLELPDLPA